MADLRELLTDYKSFVDENSEYTANWVARDILDELLTVFTAEELAQAVEAKQEGRLVVSPCKPGDIVYASKKLFRDTYFTYYVINEYVRCEVKVIKRTKTRFILSLYPLTQRAYNRNYHIFISFLQFGKTVFLTEAAAKAALAAQEETDA